MIDRQEQLNNILRYKNTPELINVITGVRRSGKSTLLQLYRVYLINMDDTRIYIQVSSTVMEETTLARELRPLKALDDNYPKYLLTMDKLPYSDFDGIRHLNILSFLTFPEIIKVGNSHTESL